MIFYRNKGGSLRLFLGNGRNMDELKTIVETVEVIANIVKTVWETIKSIKDKQKPPTQ
jgi:hypothetical protein